MKSHDIAPLSRVRVHVGHGIGEDALACFCKIESCKNSATVHKNCFCVGMIVRLDRPTTHKLTFGGPNVRIVRATAIVIAPTARYATIQSVARKPSPRWKHCIIRHQRPRLPVGCGPHVSGGWLTPPMTSNRWLNADTTWAHRPPKGRIGHQLHP